MQKFDHFHNKLDIDLALWSQVWLISGGLTPAISQAPTLQPRTTLPSRVRERIGKAKVREKTHESFWDTLVKQVKERTPPLPFTSQFYYWVWNGMEKPFGHFSQLGSVVPAMSPLSSSFAHCGCKVRIREGLDAMQALLRHS